MADAIKNMGKATGVDLAPAWLRLFSQMDQKAKVQKISILITSTLTTDGDSIGAQLGVLRILQEYSQLHKWQAPEIIIINQTKVPQRYIFILEEHEKVFNFDEHSEQMGEWLKQGHSFDFGFVVDGGLERTGEAGPFLEKAKVKIIVDHHVSGSMAHYDFPMLDVTSASTTLIIHEAIKVLGLTHQAKLAAPLYLGLIYDTGIFRHVNTTARVFKAAAEMIECQINFNDICIKGMLSRTFAAQKLLSTALSRVQLGLAEKVSYSYLTNDDFNAIKGHKDDADGIIEQIDCISGVKVSFLVLELNDKECKVSFRSKGNVNVAKFAQSLSVKGGGHARASGCTLSCKIPQAISQILAELEKVYSDTLVC